MIRHNLIVISASLPDLGITASFILKISLPPDIMNTPETETAEVIDEVLTRFLGDEVASMPPADTWGLDPSRMVEKLAKSGKLQRICPGAVDPAAAIVVILSKAISNSHRFVDATGRAYRLRGIPGTMGSVVFFVTFE